MNNAADQLIAIADELQQPPRNIHDVVRRVAENDAQLETNIDKAIVDALSGKLPTNFKRRPQSRPRR